MEEALLSQQASKASAIGTDAAADSTLPTTIATTSTDSEPHEKQRTLLLSQALEGQSASGPSEWPQSQGSADSAASAQGPPKAIQSAGDRPLGDRPGDQEGYSTQQQQQHPYSGDRSAESPGDAPSADAVPARTGGALAQEMSHFGRAWRAWLGMEGGFVDDQRMEAAFSAQWEPKTGIVGVFGTALLAVVSEISHIRQYQRGCCPLFVAVAWRRRGSPSGRVDALRGSGAVGAGGGVDGVADGLCKRGADAMPFEFNIMRPLRAIVPLHASCRRHLKIQEAAIARDMFSGCHRSSCL
jgi:hypothetical protein